MQKFIVIIAAALCLLSTACYPSTEEAFEISCTNAGGAGTEIVKHDGKFDGSMEYTCFDIEGKRHGPYWMLAIQSENKNLVRPRYLKKGQYVHGVKQGRWDRWPDEQVSINWSMRDPEWMSTTRWEGPKTQKKEEVTPR